jgi:hypothetical protein
MVSISQTQFITLKSLRRIAKMFGLTDFSHVCSLFRNLGLIYIFASEDLADEIVCLKPEAFANSIFALVRNVQVGIASPPTSPVIMASPSSSSVPPQSPPSPVLSSLSLQEINVANVPGLFPHSRLRDVWGMDSTYFSDIMALLERNGVLFNFYNSGSMFSFPIFFILALLLHNRFSSPFSPR